MSGSRPSLSAQPPQKPKPSGGNRRGIITGVIVVMLVVGAGILLIFTFGGRRQNMTAPESVGGSVLALVQEGFTKVSNGIANSMRAIFQSGKLQAENKALSERNAQLEIQLQQSQEIALENERYKTLLGYQESAPQFELMHATIIGKESSQWMSIFMVDKGSAHGIKRDMTVVCAEGLVGRVIEVGVSYSKVLSIIDRQSGVPCLVKRSRDQGVLAGQTEALNEEAYCVVSYLPSSMNVVPGDIVYTSGLNQAYPDGILIGEVIEVSRGTSETAHSVIVRPFVDFAHLENVLIITNMLSEEP